MTWEQTIEYIRRNPEYTGLVEKAYLENDLKLNVERFKASEEFMETLALIKKFAPFGKTILDIGSGNGISAVSFSLEGYKVTASEPDLSNTVGSGAIKELKKIYNLQKLEIFEEFAENIDFDSCLFDIIYARQTMHHAYNLNRFISNLSKLLKPGGLFFTARDHIVFNEEDKDWFLSSHPLQKYYGGENAFTENEYLEAFNNAGLQIKLRLKHFESVINYFPIEKQEFNEAIIKSNFHAKYKLKSKIGFLANSALLLKLYKQRAGLTIDKIWDEKTVPGRMYTFLALKN